MSAISRRVDKLEREAIGVTQMFVLYGPANYDTDKALADLHIKLEIAISSSISSVS